MRAAKTNPRCISDLFIFDPRVLKVGVAENQPGIPGSLGPPSRICTQKSQGAPALRPGHPYVLSETLLGPIPDSQPIFPPLM